MKFMKKYIQVLSLVFEKGKFLFIAIGLVNILIACLRPAILSAERRVVNRVDLLYRDKSLFIAFVLVLIVYVMVHIVDSILNIFLNILMLRFGVKMDRELNLAVNEKCSKIPAEYYDSHLFHEKLQEASAGIYKIIQAVPFTFIVFIGGALSFLTVSGYLFNIEKKFLIIILFSMIPHYLFVFLKGNYTKRYIKDSSKMNKEVEYYKKSILEKNSFMELRTHLAVSSMGGYWHSSLKQLHHLKMKNGYRYELYYFVVGFIDILTRILIFGYGLYCVAINRLDIGAFTVFISSIELIKNTLNQIINHSGDLAECVISAEFYFDFIRMDDNELRYKEEVCPISFDTVSVKNVCFAYPDVENYALKDINFEVKNKRRIAIVGPNGSGKTTLAKMLLGIYNPNEGEVCFDNNNYNELMLSDLYGASSSLFQQFKIYNTNMIENISFGKPYDTIAIESMLEKLNIQLERYPEGLKTKIGSEFGGIELSGGQGQKVALARVYIKNGALVVLDEPTSAIDPRDEHVIMSEYKTITQDKLSFVITHRLGFAKTSDFILVIKDGKVFESGSHEELMDKKGYYSDLFHQYSKLYA